MLPRSPNELAHVYGLITNLQAQINGISAAAIKPGKATAGLFACTPGSVAVGDAVKELVAGAFCAPAQATSPSNAAIGICLQIVNPALVLIVYNGELAIFSSLIPETIYYLDAIVPGGVVSTAPSAVGQIVQPLGRAKSSTTLVVEITSRIVQL